MPTPHDDPFDLDRFVSAQQRDYQQALSELRRGRKESHWMWYVFPQLRGLGHSQYALRYGIATLDEARAYLAHPVLGPRLLECVGALLSLPGCDPVAVLGSVDALKLRSCLTLFCAADKDNQVFDQALHKFHAGLPDERTLALLDTAGPA